MCESKQNSFERQKLATISNSLANYTKQRALLPTLLLGRRQDTLGEERLDRMWTCKIGWVLLSTRKYREVTAGASPGATEQ